MSVYVDSIVDYGWVHGPSCHMRADTLEELHDFASGLGLKREWFQDRKSPHYDLTISKRKLAVSMGAVELNRKEWVNKFPRLKKSESA